MIILSPAPTGSRFGAINKKSASTGRPTCRDLPIRCTGVITESKERETEL